MCVVAFLLSSLSDLCLCLSGVVCVTSIRIRFTTTRKTGSSPFSPPHAFLPSYWVPGLFAWYGLHAYGPLSQRIRRNISYVANGWCKYLKWFETETRVFIGDSDDGNEWDWLRLGSSTFWATEGGKSSGWQGWYSMELPPRNLLRPLPRPTLGHLFRHSYIVMTIILRRSLTLQTGHHTSLRLLCCFRSVRNSVYTVPLYSMFPVPCPQLPLYGSL